MSLKIINTRSILLWLTLIALSVIAHAQSIEALIENGNTAYHAGQFAAAQSWFEQAVAKDTGNHYPESTFNLGTALFRQKKYSTAITQFNKITDSDIAATLKSAAFYNAGNCFLQQKNYAAALEAYKNALLLNPRDEDARYNFTLTENLLGAQQSNSVQNPVAKPKEITPPPTPENLTPEEQRRLLDELNAAEQKTVQQRPKKLQQKKSSLKDW